MSMGARVGHNQEDGDPQYQETPPLLLPQINRISVGYHVRGEDDST
jgi:hypothetical protein